MQPFEAWRARIKAVLDRDITIRYFTAVLPAIPVGSVERNIVWDEAQGGPLPTNRYSINPTIAVTGPAGMRLEVAWKAGSRTREGCTLILGTEDPIPAGQVVEVVAVHYPPSALGGT